MAVTYIKRAQPRDRASDEAVRAAVAEMLADIEAGGLESVRRHSRRLDGWDPPSFSVSPELISAAEQDLDPALRGHVDFALAQVQQFAQQQLATLDDLEVNTLPGVTLGHRHLPVGAVGAYVPGGRYPMVASALMTIAVAKVAGVERVVACAPPTKGHGVHPATLYAMHAAGADAILCLGGVQALATMAFGIGDLTGEVDMIVGAGNAYVAEAKRQLFGRVGIDLLAGPTEVLAIAEPGADEELVAADLLGQAEHGPTSPAVLVATSTEVATGVAGHVERLLATWPTAEVAGAAWSAHGEVVVAHDRREAIELANGYAFEHVEVHADYEHLDSYLDGLRNYGSLFLGPEATVAYGDKAVGTNHVLPTGRAARYSGGLWVGKFLKTVTYQRLTEEGTRRVAPAAAAISQAEHMPGHALTALMRLERAGPGGTA